MILYVSSITKIIINLKSYIMKKLFSFSAISLLMCILTSSNLTGQSKVTRNISGFEGVNFGISGNLYVKLGSDFQVVLEGDADYIEDVKTEVRNGKLYIRMENFNIFRNERANVYVTLPVLSSLSMSGSGKAEVEGLLKTEILEIGVSGSGRINIPEVKTGEMKCSISGSGDIYIQKGDIGMASLSISGSGNYSGENAAIRSFDAGISGSGSCKCSVTEELKARISGSGSIYYRGTPRIDVRSSGSGKVRSM